MTTTTQSLPPAQDEHSPWLSLRLPFGLTTTTTALIGIVLLAAFLRFANIAAIGDANLYYTAAVKSMLQSPANFFFAAAEPGGSVMVDKPPVGLWLQALSAMIFGVNGFAVSLPQILAGILAVPLIFHLVRRSFGNAAGLLAAFALAVTPVSIATERNNTMDATLIFTLLLAAWAFIRATETSQRRFLLLGAALVGIGFNIKMLQAFLPLPAFYALYFFGAQAGWWRKIRDLFVASVLLLAISLSWAITVDLIPADQRPYVGSSTNNTVMELIIGHNGISRLVGGMGGLRGGPAPSGAGQLQIIGSVPGDGTGASSGLPSSGTGPIQIIGSVPGDGTGASSGLPSSGTGPIQIIGSVPGDGTGAPSGSPSGGAGPIQIIGSVPGGGTGTANMQPLFIPPTGGNVGPMMGMGQGGEIGAPGVLRLFSASLAKDASWLLPFALASIALLALSRWRRPLTAQQQGLLIWGSWLLICCVFFSFASFYHAYYLAMMAPPLAVLLALGALRLWQLGTTRPILAAILLIALAAGTLAFQLFAASLYTAQLWWMAVPLLLALAGAVLLVLALIRQAARLRPVGFSLICIALLVVPTIWSALTTFDPAPNATLPHAYAGERSAWNQLPFAAPQLPTGAATNNQRQGPPGMPGMTVNQELLSYLQANTQDTEYLMVVPSAIMGAPYVLATGRPVLYAGGFLGTDKVIDAESLSEMVDQERVRYVLWNGGGGMGPMLGSESNGISDYLATACQVVTDVDLGRAAEDVIAGGAIPSPAQGLPGINLYQCGG